MLLQQNLIAQTKSITVTGVVYDQTGETLPGAIVQLKGTQTSVSTSLNGTYSIKVPNEQSVLVFSFIGYAKLEQTVGNKKIIDVALKEISTGLDEVVVIGYGTVKKPDLTGSVGQVNIVDMQKAPVRSFEEALAGRVAGVQVSSDDGQPGSSYSIVIRGNNSITQDNSPLYVIDGFPIENPDNNILNPSEIESITVLKDASSTAIYGSRGANGVVIITTKRGVIGQPVITYNGYYGTQKTTNKIKVLNPYDFVKYQQIANASSSYLSDGKILEDYRNVEGVDWQEKLFGKARPFQNHSLSISGGTKATRYSISGSGLLQDGIIVNSGANRYQGRVVIDQEINSKLKVGINTNYTNQKFYGTSAKELSNSSSNTSNLLYSVWGYRPVSGSFDIDLEDDPLDNEIDLANDSRFNPLYSAENELRRSTKNVLVSNGYADYSFTKNLKLRVSAGLTKETNKAESFDNTKTRAGSPLTSAGRSGGVKGSVNYNERNSYVNENILTYTKAFKKIHKVTAIGGFIFQGVNVNSFGAGANLIPNENLVIAGIDEGIPLSISSNASSSTLASFLSRVNYDYRSKYLFGVSFRADGSSKFSPGNKWSYFPSVSGAWKITEEKFMKDIPVISTAKLRGSYGITGNNRVPDFAYLSTLSFENSYSYAFDNVITKGSVPSILGNPDLQWENTSQADLGLELGFFKNRISLEMDLYRKTTYDLLLNASLPPSLGFSNSFKNIGKVQNQGLEITLSSVNLNKKNFKWSSDFNISFNQNKVLQLTQNQETLISLVNWDNFYRTIPAYIAKVGSPIAQFYGFVWDGVYQLSDFDQTSTGEYILKSTITTNGNTTVRPGDIKYKDLNGDRVVDSKDWTAIGNPNPDFYGGFSNNFAYKAFDLNVFFQFSSGGQILNANRLVFEGNGRPSQNQYATVLNAWSMENQNNELFRVGGAGPRAYSTRVLEDASFIRLKTVQLGYNLPKKYAEKIKLKSLKFYTSAQNLFTLDNYSGLDPEVSTKNSALTPAFDFSAYPRATTITLGLNVSL